MSNHLLLSLNFWEAKQLEYWLKDNYPNCHIKVVNADVYTPPEHHEYYKIEGEVDVDLACMIQLKYGLGKLEHGKD
jgi:hypothetical protein